MIKISEGLKIFKRRLRIKIKGLKRYKGDYKNIIKAIIRDCWNGYYFNASSGHFKIFYIRDFAWSIRALITLGYNKEVKKTLDYIIRLYMSKFHVSVAIYKDKLFDFPNYGVDSFPYLVRSYRIANELMNYSNPKALEFFKRYSKKYFNTVIDKKTSLVKPSKYFSSIKDHELRRSSCYDNTMIGMLANDLKHLNINNPLPKGTKKILNKHFWNGRFFNNDLYNKNFSSDSNLFPFWTGIYDYRIKDNKRLLMSIFEYINENNLNKPFPLKYSKEQPKRLIFESIFAPNYEGTTIWTHIGLIYIELLSKVNKEAAKHYLEVYRRYIERYKTFLELYNPDGTPYRSLFYYSDEGMLWSAYFLWLYEDLR